MPTDELRTLDLTLPTPAENLACDEALLDWCDESGLEVLRFWEPGTVTCPGPASAAPPHYVVLGYANRVAKEVLETACAESGVPIYRRCTGGGAVLQGPGCLNYSLVLRISRHRALASVTGTNQHVMERHRAAVEALLAEAATTSCQPVSSPNRPRLEPLEVGGHTDLALGGRKFSGNAQRRKRRALLFHGTFLWGFDLSQVSRFLKFPSRQSDYRQGRSHDDFLMNLPLSPVLLKQAVSQTWHAAEPLEEWPERQARRLAAEKYETNEWNLKF